MPILFSVCAWQAESKIQFCLIRQRLEDLSVPMLVDVRAAQNRM
jgi:hypothetical protein